MRHFTISFLLLLISANLLYAKDKIRYKLDGAKPKHIDSMCYILPVCQVGYSNSEGNLVVNATASADGQKELKRAVNYYYESFNISQRFDFKDPFLLKAIQDEIINLFRNAENGKYFEQVGVGGKLDSIMDATHNRFLLLFADQGIIARTQAQSELASADNLSALIRREAAPHDTGAVVNGSNLYAMIIDARENKTYIYNASGSTEEEHFDPLDTDSLIVQLHRVFEGVYFSKPGLDRW